MAKTFKNIKLTKARDYLVGSPVPKEKNGNVGQMVQDTLDALGYQTNHSAGPDIPSLYTEIKSKSAESLAPYSIGSMTLEDIKKYDYDRSPIKDKLQTHFQVIHSQIFREVVEADTLDFSKDYIQEKFRYAYNSARDLVLNGCESNYIRGRDSCGYFERKKKSGGKLTNCWSFRIPVKEMVTVRSMAKSNFENIFEII